MGNTSFVSAIQATPGVKGYNERGVQMPWFTQSYMQGSGGLRSTTADLLKYGTYLLNNKTPVSNLVLKKTIVIDAGTNKVTTTTPADIVDDRIYYASLNWFQYNPSPGREQIWADGGTLGFCCYIILYTQAKLCVVLLCNTSGQHIAAQLQTIAEKIFNAISQTTTKHTTQ